MTVVTLPFLLMGFRAPLPAREPGPHPPPPHGANLTIEPYPLKRNDGQRVRAELGRLRVPENRSRPGSRRIELAFLRLKSTAARPGPPIVFLAGGPGDSGIETVQGPGFDAFMALTEVADVIALDQRGTGRSEPRMDCPATWDFPLDRPGDPREMLAIAAERVRFCARERLGRGIDLSAYNTRESADDVEDLRQALGAPKISLWGVSYGTHLALATVQRHGRRIHRVILTGTDGPDHAMLKLPSTVEQQLDRVDRLCKADPRVRPILPDFRGLVKTTLARLEEGPVTVEVKDPQSGQNVTVTVGPWDFQFFTAHAVTVTWRLMQLPSQYAPLSRGDFTPLAQETLRFRRGPVPSMMGLPVICAAGASPARRARVRREARETLLGDAINFPFPDLCAALGPMEHGPVFRAPVRSRVPALFISGTLDGNTPVSNADEVRRGFPNSYHLVVEGASHGYDLFYFIPRVRQAMREFLMGQPPSTRRIPLASFPFILENKDTTR
jgi:pimeloyl-ACP methyl ester carboxylesterase